MLVLCSADVDAKTSDGETAFAIMLRFGLEGLSSRLFRERIGFLLAQGANPLAVDNKGSTPTLKAAGSGLMDDSLSELAHAGYDFRDIVEHSIRLHDEFIKNSRGGISSSIDNIVYGPRPTRRSPKVNK